MSQTDLHKLVGVRIFHLAAWRGLLAKISTGKPISGSGDIYNIIKGVTFHGRRDDNDRELDSIEKGFLEERDYLLDLLHHSIE